MHHRGEGVVYIQAVVVYAGFWSLFVFLTVGVFSVVRGVISMSGSTSVI